MRLEEWAFVHPDKYKYISTITGNAVTDELVRTVADDFETCWQKNTIIYGSDDRPKYLGTDADKGTIAWLRTSITHDEEPIWMRFVLNNREGALQRWFCERFVTNRTAIDEILSCGYFRFADIVFEDLSAGNQFLCEVASKAMPEKWRYENYESPIDLPILRSYIEHTYYRLKEENKVLRSHRQNTVLFNLGLLERQFLRDIYIEADMKTLHISEELEIPVLEKPRLVFEEDHQVRNYSGAPQLPEYFTRMDQVVFNPDLEIHLRWTHIFEERATERMPKNLIGENQEKRQEVVRNFRGNAEILRKLARRNYKMVVPQYYNGQIQFLLPVYLGTTFEGTPDFALVLSLDTESDPPVYVATTILTVEMAYQNARLLAKPETPWLISNLAD